MSDCSNGNRLSVTGTRNGNGQGFRNSVGLQDRDRFPVPLFDVFNMPCHVALQEPWSRICDAYS